MLSNHGGARNIKEQDILVPDSPFRKQTTDVRDAMSDKNHLGLVMTQVPQY
jgi:hypothetical protein